jgi:hypothetical protein
LSAAISFRDAIEFAARHWDKIVVGYGALKAAGFLANAGSAGGALMGEAAGMAAGKMGLGGKIAAVSLVASAVYIGGQAIADLLLSRQAKQIEAKGRIDESTLGLFDKAKADDKQIKALFSMAKMQGIADETGKVNLGAVAAGLEQADIKERSKWLQSLGMPMSNANTYAEPIAKAVATQFETLFAKFAVSNVGELMSKGSPALSNLAKVEKPKVNVTINRIEVASDDPDRWAFRFVDAVRDAGRNPSGAAVGMRALASRGG